MKNKMKSAHHNQESHPSKIDAILKGVVCTIANQDGEVVGSGHDFSENRPGGFSIKEMQEIRAKEAAYKNFFSENCSNDISEVINDHQLNSIVDLLVRNKHYKVHLHYIGY